MSRRSLLRFLPGSAFVLLVGFAAWILVCSPGGLDATESRTAALVIVVVALWATNLVPEYLAALLFFLVAMLFSVAPAAVLFSGFRTAAFWLVLGGLVIGIAVTTTGFGVRVARWIACRLKGGYASLIGSVTGLGVVFGFLMPSAMGRVILLVPIAVAVADHFGFQKGSNGRRGVVLAMALGSFVPTFAVLTANVPNMVLAGMSEAQHGVTFLYGEYLLLHFPVLGLLKAVLIAWLIVRLFPDVPGPIVDDGFTESGELSRGERVLGVTLLILVALWMSDFMHGISPAWIALGGAAFLMFPGIRVVSQKTFNEKLNFASLLFVAAILGLGNLVAESGLGGRFADAILAGLPLDHGTPFFNYLAISVTSLLTGLFTTLPGVPAVMTPIADELAQVTGFSTQAVLMTQVIGFSTMLFPYQAPPIVVGLQLAGENNRGAIKVSLLLALISLVFLLPLNYLWWRLLGWLG